MLVLLIVGLNRTRFWICKSLSQTNVFSAEELAENSNVQDAFVIAVEQQARERLEKLSALRKIKPVDMTTLSQQLCESETTSREADVIVEKDQKHENASEIKRNL